MKSSKNILVGICSIALVLPFTASALSINLHVEALSGVLYTNPALEVGACAITDDPATTTVSAKCALEQAGLNPVWSNFGGDDLFLAEAGGVAQDFGNNLFWGWWSDLEYGQVALNKHELSDGEDLLVALGMFPLRLSVSADPTVGETVTVTVEEFGFDASFNGVWVPSSGTTVHIGADSFTTNASGMVETVPASESPLDVFAEKAGFIQSAHTEITPTIPPISIHLHVEAPGGTLYENDIHVSACRIIDSADVESISAKCALEQAGLNPVWSSFGGDDLFLAETGGVAQDFGSNLFWGWWSDLEYGQVALNKHELSDGEDLLVALGLFPLRIQMPTGLMVGSSATILAEEFGFDESFNGAWSPASSTALSVNGIVHESNGTGTIAFTATSTDPVWITAHKTNFVSASTSATPGTPPPPPVGGGGTPPVVGFDIQNALIYLTSKQQADGAFANPVLTDWVAVAYASTDPGPAKTSLRNYLITSSPALSSATDYERHAMALMALGINPYSGGTRDYISPIIAKFDGTQIGETGFVNDDIFALLPLLKAGYGASDPIVTSVVTFVLAQQSANGSWDGTPDMTSAAMQALGPLPMLPGVNAALGRAVDYLKSTQQSDGGWSNVDSTSWVMTAINASNETHPTPESAWASPTGKLPKEFLATEQKPDGGMQAIEKSPDTRVWSTAYAVTAGSGKSWVSLLQTFAKPSQTQATNGGSSTGSIPVATTTATSTIAAATSTPIVATTTPTVLGEATSTEPQVTAAAPSTTPKAKVKKIVPAAKKPSAPKSEPTIIPNTVNAMQAAVLVPETTKAPGVFGRIWKSISSFFGRVL